MYRDLQTDDAALATCVQSPPAKPAGFFLQGHVVSAVEKAAADLIEMIQCAGSTRWHREVYSPEMSLPG